MDFFEIAKGKLVSNLGVFGMRRVNPEMPFPVFFESAGANKLILLLRRRMMISPCIVLIHGKVPARDQFARINEAVLV